MTALAGVIGRRYNGNALQRLICSENHDEDYYANGNARLPEQIWPGNADSFYAQKRSTLVAALVFTAPGIPMIFMGQEFLTWGAWSDGEQLDWSNADRFPGIINLYRDLIHLRRNWYNNTRARAKHQRLSRQRYRQGLRLPSVGKRRCRRRCRRDRQSVIAATIPTVSACRAPAYGGCASTATGEATVQPSPTLQVMICRPPSGGQTQCPAPGASALAHTPRSSHRRTPNGRPL